MADPMQRPMGPPNGNSQPLNRSVANPIDATMMAQKGQLGKNTTVRDFIENVLRVPLDAPVSALAQAIKQQAQGATMEGKIRSQTRPQPGGMGQPRPGMGQPQESGGLSDLLGV